MTAIYDNIKYYAGKKGMSLQEVAIKAKLSKNIIYQYNGKVNPSMETLDTIAEVLGVKRQDLAKNSDSEQENTQPKKVDIADDDVIMTFEGKPIPPEDLELMKRLLRGKK